MPFVCQAANAWLGRLTPPRQRPVQAPVRATRSKPRTRRQAATRRAPATSRRARRTVPPRWSWRTHRVSVRRVAGSSEASCLSPMWAWKRNPPLPLDDFHNPGSRLSYCSHEQPTPRRRRPTQDPRRVPRHAGRRARRAVARGDVRRLWTGDVLRARRAGVRSIPSAARA